MTATSKWNVVHRRGSAADLHALVVPEGATRELWWFEVDRPALVLGSTQAESTIRIDACRDAGIDVVRRRSGGGSVLMLPGEMAWLDVVIGRDDPLWDDDIGRATWWLGEAWSSALDAVGLAQTSVHRGGMVSNQWSRTVCFAGLGPGEVTAATSTGPAAKVLGLSQRRTRAWARFQCAVHLVWRPELVASLLAPPGPSSTDLSALVAHVDAPVTGLEAAVTAALMDG